MSEINYSDSISLKAGDKIKIKMPPPLTWWDKFLWRALGIERKREWVWRDMTVVASSTPNEQ